MENTGNREIFSRMIDEAGSICILGHIGPDGDCVGSALAIRNYIRNRRPSLAEEDVRVFLDEMSPKFEFLPGFSEICHDGEEKRVYDLAIVTDCAEAKRTARFAHLLDSSRKSFMIDHHVTNPGFCDFFVVRPDASSASEVAFDLFEEAYIDRNVALYIYTGLVHDTGVFRYPATSTHTMAIAARCMEFGIDFGSVIDDSFFGMSYEQKKMQGIVLERMERYFDGRLVISYADRESMEPLGLVAKDMDGMIDQLRGIRGVWMAVFLYQMKDRSYTLSMRSNVDAIDVSSIALKFGGGGHRRAAGATLGSDLAASMEMLKKEFEVQLAEYEASIERVSV